MATVCDRHPDRRAMYTICFGVQETVDLCKPCSDEIRTWVAETETKLYNGTKVAQSESTTAEGDDNEEQKGLQKEEVLAAPKCGRRKK